MIISTLKVLFQHKRQAIPDLTKVELPSPFRGRPQLTAKNIDREKLDFAASNCPTGALSTSPLSLDMGRCLFCGECARILPDNVCFTTSWHLWSLTRDGLVIRADQSPSSEPVEPKYPMFRRALKLRQVCAGGDAANEMELNACGNVNFDMRRLGIEFVASPRHADGVVVTGPVTAKMAAPLEMTYAAIPQPRVLIAVGADAISGGVFADSPAIDRSFFTRHTPDLYVAGHPAHPLAFIAGVRALIGG